MNTWIQKTCGLNKIKALNGGTMPAVLQKQMNYEIDENPFLDPAQRLMCWEFARASEQEGIPFTDLIMSHVVLRISATDYVNIWNAEGGETPRALKALRTLDRASLFRAHALAEAAPMPLLVVGCVLEDLGRGMMV